MTRMGPPQSTWGQPPSAVQSSEARRGFACAKIAELRSAGQPRAAVPTWTVVILWLNCCLMFARRIRVEYEENGRRVPCPLKWLDSFSMRNFTNATVFDNTLPVADGVMEIGTHVPVQELKAAMEDWFRRKSYLPKAGVLILTESNHP
jgi:hypothetical protein